MSPLALFAFFHLNIHFSSVRLDQRTEVIARCYWPLLDLAEASPMPIGIEAPADTLRVIAEIDPAWIAALRRLMQAGRVEFIGSGQAQIIGPLVPARVVEANLGLGRLDYLDILGTAPRLWLVNEQAFSQGLTCAYRAAGAEAVLLDWDNASAAHPDIPPEWRYGAAALPSERGMLGALWTQTVVFQKVQRLAHGDADEAETLAYLARHRAALPRYLCLYSGDAEIFDFRPGRYRTEAALSGPSEWDALRGLLERLSADPAYRLIGPGAAWREQRAIALERPVVLGTAQEPVLVKKQPKYNLTRWALTGRDDLGINTACHQMLRTLDRPWADAPDDWRRLCSLWASDFRTHITPERWTTLAAELPRSVAAPSRGAAPRLEAGTSVSRHGTSIRVETDHLLVSFNARRGLALDSLRLKGPSGPGAPVVGTIQHGYYDQVAFAADWYSGHCVIERPSAGRITDLSRAEPAVAATGEEIRLSVRIETELGPIHKTIVVERGAPRLRFEIDCNFSAPIVGTFRLGHVTLMPDAFAAHELDFRTHLGGPRPQTFPLYGHEVDHGAATSFLVSTRTVLGMTEGFIDFGDRTTRVEITVDQTAAALGGLMTHRWIGEQPFTRFALSAAELDETRRPDDAPWRLAARFALSARTEGPA